jgi:lytic murein transglycosylase
MQKSAGLQGKRGLAMPTLSSGISCAAAALAASLLLASTASAQPLPAPARPAPARPPAASPAATAPRPAPAATSVAPRGGAACHNGMSFDRFLSDLKQRAVAEGVSQRALAAAAPYLVYDQGIVNRDRGQRVFGQIFTQFAGRMAAPYRMQQGQAHIKNHAAAFARAEKEYGVPPAVIAAFWGLESDFGANMGNLPVLPSLVSLAYDCRRAEMFEKETIAALKIVERGDLAPSEMIGSWAGELGQTQFLPTHYFNYAVDYDGDGHRNLLRSGPDVIGSTANYIATGLKWRRGEPWLQEVRVPQNLTSGFSWDQADLTVKHPRSKWAAWGVTYPDGKPLPNDDLPASVVLPMGRTGPAFMAYANFAAYTEWNNSLIYSITAGYLATRIAGAPPMRQPAQPVAQLQFNEIKELQQHLVRAGFNVGKVDGVLGQASRTAVKAMQLKYGLPADSWPTAELLARMRGPGVQAQPAGALLPQAR